MDRLEPRAAAAYILATELAADAWLLPAMEYVGRYLCLRQMLSPADPLAELVAARLGALAPGSPVAVTHDATDEFPETMLPGWDEFLKHPRNAVPAATMGCGEGGGIPGNTSPLETRFMTGTSPTLGAPWSLTIGDPDWFPSIPHGHLRDDRGIRLDVYTGYTFNRAKGERHEARERRSFIIAVWNNQAFRGFATNAIKHFMAGNPCFCWRVPNPLRLPRVRPIH